MSESTKGRYREYQVSRDMQTHGWQQGMRAAGSKGAADLFMVHPTYGIALVQVGKVGKSLGPADRLRFLDLAGMAGALPILATVIPDPGRATTIRYFRVYDSPPANWEPWDPAKAAA